MGKVGWNRLKVSDLATDWATKLDVHQLPELPIIRSGAIRGLPNENTAPLDRPFADFQRHAQLAGCYRAGELSGMRALWRRSSGSTSARASTRAPMRANSKYEPTSLRCRKMVSGGGGRRSPRRNVRSNPSARTREGRSDFGKSYRPGVAAVRRRGRSHRPPPASVLGSHWLPRSRSEWPRWRPRRDHRLITARVMRA